ncbi:MAG TPA: ABC transporter ATP-binding protein [Puia sp.]|nr:ABC transporter ATP-binding protein [Puia sp.]
MRITLIDAGKRFNRDWIFRHLHYEFIAGHTYAITGPNGSGKSTLLQVIGGAIGMSEGSAKYQDPEISVEQVYKQIAIAAPYLELIEEMTATEFLRFHQSFKPFLPSCAIPDILSQVGLGNAAHKQIRYYSSGMRQRARLAQAIFSDTPVILLDEPCTNLDSEGIALYRQLIRDYCTGRMVIVSSNDTQEYDFCEKILPIGDYK